MITGAHVIVYSTDADAVRAFFGEVLGLDSVDGGGGWPIYALPPSEVAVHPVESGSSHELYLMCDDIDATVARLAEKGFAASDGVIDAGWGRRASFSLPDGSSISIYEPRHQTAHAT